MNKLVNGIVELLNSPSGAFSLLCLIAISIITGRSPIIGVGGFVAFFAVVPAVLALVEHREQMVQLNQPPESIIQTITNISKGTL